MSTQMNESPSTLILQRIDAIIAELQSLRQQVLTIYPPETPPANLVDELTGALGQGAWGEYDLQHDWQRFDT